MSASYAPILVLVAFAGLICAAMVTLSYVLGPKKVTPYKQSPYECGVQPLGDATERFPIKFYLVAMLFILFDIEVVFLWGWITVFKNAPVQFQIFSFGEMMVYMALWIVGYLYAIKVGAVDWDGSYAKEEEKHMLADGDRLAVEEAS